jgi:hypothetical protein
MKESKYAKELVQLPADHVVSSNPNDWKCDFTGVADNLWLNLSDGKIGSGRTHPDGSGGNGVYPSDICPKNILKKCSTFGNEVCQNMLKKYTQNARCNVAAQRAWGECHALQPCTMHQRMSEAPRHQCEPALHMREHASGAEKDTHKNGSYNIDACWSRKLVLALLLRHGCFELQELWSPTRVCSSACQATSHQQCQIGAVVGTTTFGCGRRLKTSGVSRAVDSQM